MWNENTQEERIEPLLPRRVLFQWNHSPDNAIGYPTWESEGPLQSRKTRMNKHERSKESTHQVTISSHILRSRDDVSCNSFVHMHTHNRNHKYISIHARISLISTPSRRFVGALPCTHRFKYDSPVSKTSFKAKSRKDIATCGDGRILESTSKACHVEVLSIDEGRIHLPCVWIPQKQSSLRWTCTTKGKKLFH